ncbi:hypothetical protein [Synechococcus phage S-H34]|uniref:Uncharacterized protein n=1 Tax=Synechococcus phage S-H34 TaxID=2718942 RepID=A0A6G8R6D4_9CAUD|nr:hypothetical protein PQC15_gp073 [Synechococcus phage S-H34]QIN96944.1 hypothetical protein [Synechococcus phage S-H34]
METDRTGAMLRDTYNCCSCIAGGVFSLALFAGVFFVVHEEFRPSGRFAPRGTTEYSLRVFGGVE